MNKGIIMSILGLISYAIYLILFIVTLVVTFDIIPFVVWLIMLILGGIGTIYFGILLVNYYLDRLRQ